MKVASSPPCAEESPLIKGDKGGISLIPYAQHRITGGKSFSRPVLPVKWVLADAFQIKSLSVNRFRYRIGKLTATEQKLIIDSVLLCIGV
jgi:hypothetical protein